MSDEKKIYVVVDHSISYMGTKIEKGETIEMTQAEAENIGLELVRPVDESELAEGQVTETETPAEVPAEEVPVETEQAPEGESTEGDKPAEVPAEETPTDEVVE